MPEIRKINDIAIRERSTKDSNSKFKDLAADAINGGSEKNISNYNMNTLIGDREGDIGSTRKRDLKK